MSLATLATVTTAFAEGGFIEIDATHQKGLYRLDLKNTSVAASKGRSVTYYLYGAANMAPVVFDIELTGWDNQDGVRGGMTALPNAAANAAGGLPVSTAGALDLDEMNVDIEAIQTSTAGLTYTVSNQVDANVLDWKSATAPAMTGDAYARLGAPAGASIAADLAEIEGETDLIVTATNTGAAPGAAGGLFIAGTNAATSITTGLTAHLIGTVDTLTTYTGNTPQTGDAYLRLGAPAGASVSADLAEIEGETDTINTFVSASTAQTGDCYARLGAPAGASIAADLVEIEGETDGIAGLTTGVNVTSINSVSTSPVTTVKAVQGLTTADLVGISSNVKTNQALTHFQFLMTDATTHAPKTLLTVTCTRSIDGGSYGAGTLANVTEIANGTYTVDFGAGDLNGKVIVLQCTANGADTTFERLVTQP